MGVPTSVSPASNGSSPGLMDELPLRYAGWKSRPRKPTKFLPGQDRFREAAACSEGH